MTITIEKKIKKCEMAIEKGYKYDPLTGIINGVRGKDINTKNPRGYIKFQFKNENEIYSILAHQFAWFYCHKQIAEEIDHINGNKTDNRIENLRSVTHQQNMWNVVKAKGYSYHKKSKKYMAYIVINKKMNYLGYFKNENDAKESYLKAKKQLHKY
jgi:hypothetical protein